MRLTTLNIVVLPAPFGPMRPQIWPGSTPNESESKATIPPNRTLTEYTSKSATYVVPSASRLAPPTNRPPGDRTVAAQFPRCSAFPFAVPERWTDAPQEPVNHKGNMRSERRFGRLFRFAGHALTK